MGETMYSVCTTDQHPTNDCYKKCAYVGNKTSAASANIRVFYTRILNHIKAGVIN